MIEEELEFKIFIDIWNFDIARAFALFISLSLFQGPSKNPHCPGLIQNYAMRTKSLVKNRGILIMLDFRMRGIQNLNSLYSQSVYRGPESPI